MKPVLSTDSITLKPPIQSDAEDLYRLRAHPDVNRYIQRTIPTCVADVEQFIAQRSADTDGFYFIINTRPEAEFAGAICLWNIDKETRYAEVGYELLPAFQGKGIMAKALREIIHFAFTVVNIETLEALTHLDNRSSRKLLEAANFRLVPGKTDPDNSNNVTYSLKKARM